MSFSKKFCKKSPFKADTAPWSGKLYQGGGMNTNFFKAIGRGVKKVLGSENKYSSIIGKKI